MKLHLWIWGGIGAGVAVALGLIGMNVAPQANVGCLASLLIPFVVGCVAARISVGGNRTTSLMQGAIDGGFAAGIAAVLGGAVNLLTGCAVIPSRFTANGPSQVLGLLLPGLIALGIAYFVQGFVVGIVAVSLRSASKD